MTPTLTRSRERSPAYRRVCKCLLSQSSMSTEAQLVAEGSRRASGVYGAIGTDTAREPIAHP